MKKNNITLVFVAIVFSIIVGMIIGKSLLKYKEGDPDVVGSFSMNRDENLTVVANRKNISDKEAFARLLLKMYSLRRHSPYCWGHRAAVDSSAVDPAPACGHRS